MRLLLTGPPGIGKTTACIKLAQLVGRLPFYYQVKPATVAHPLVVEEVMGSDLGLNRLTILR